MAVMSGPRISVALNAKGSISSQWLIQKTSGPRIFDSPTDTTRTEYFTLLPPSWNGCRRGSASARDAYRLAEQGGPVQRQCHGEGGPGVLWSQRPGPGPAHGPEKVLILGPQGAGVRAVHLIGPRVKGRAATEHPQRGCVIFRVRRAGGPEHRQPVVGPQRCRRW